MELLEKVLFKENLNNVYKQVYKNKGVSGVDGITVDELFDYIKDCKEEILWKIRNCKYKPQPVRRVYIPKENGELRKLGIPSVVDGVLQKAISKERLNKRGLLNSLDHYLKVHIITN